MKHKTLAYSLLALASTASAQAWAACTTAVVEADGITTVTVTATLGDNCSWADNNPNNSIAFQLDGVAVINPLSPIIISGFSASAVNQDANGVRRESKLYCTSSTACADTFSHYISVPPSQPKQRICAAVGAAALSAIATCIFVDDD